MTFAVRRRDDLHLIVIPGSVVQERRQPGTIPHDAEGTGIDGASIGAGPNPAREARVVGVPRHHEAKLSLLHILGPDEVPWLHRPAPGVRHFSPRSPRARCPEALP